MFNQQLFNEYLSTSWLGRNFSYYEQLDSTNSFVKQLDSDSSLHGLVVLTDNQTSGRGQHNREWEVAPGFNLTFSLVLNPQKVERLTLLTLACALAVSNAINKQLYISTELKWPNDVLFKNKKLCGILTETQFSGNVLEKVIIGIGLNVNQSIFNADLKDKATSLVLIAGEEISRERLLAGILHKIEHYYRLWNHHNPELINQINESMMGYGNWVKLLLNNQMLNEKYKFLGVNNSGSLVALNQNLEVRTFSFEQVRVLI